MRKVRESLRELLENNPIETILLLDIGNGNSVLNQKLTSCPFDLLVDNELYISTVDISGIDLPKNSQVIDKETYTIQLSDPTGYYADYFNIGLTNTPVVLRALFVNTSSENYTASNSVVYEPESIITSKEDSIIIYKGLINNAEYLIDSANNSSVLKIMVVSALASLDNKAAVRTTKNYIQSINPIDTSFDSVFESKQQISLKWGKV